MTRPTVSKVHKLVQRYTKDIVLRVDTGMQIDGTSVYGALLKLPELEGVDKDVIKRSLNSAANKPRGFASHVCSTSTLLAPQGTPIHCCTCDPQDCSRPIDTKENSAMAKKRKREPSLSDEQTAQRLNTILKELNRRHGDTVTYDSAALASEEIADIIGSTKTKSTAWFERLKLLGAAISEPRKHAAIDTTRQLSLEAVSSMEAALRLSKRNANMKRATSTSSTTAAAVPVFVEPAAEPTESTPVVETLASELTKDQLIEVMILKIQSLETRVSDLTKEKEELETAVQQRLDEAAEQLEALREKLAESERTNVALVETSNKVDLNTINRIRGLGIDI